MRGTARLAFERLHDHGLHRVISDLARLSGAPFIVQPIQPLVELASLDVWSEVMLARGVLPQFAECDQIWKCVETLPTEAQRSGVDVKLTNVHRQGLDPFSLQFPAQ